MPCEPPSWHSAGSPSHHPCSGMNAFAEMKQRPELRGENLHYLPALICWAVQRASLRASVAALMASPGTPLETSTPCFLKEPRRPLGSHFLPPYHLLHCTTAEDAGSVYSLCPPDAKGPDGEFWGVQWSQELGKYLGPFVMQVRGRGAPSQPKVAANLQHARCGCGGCATVVAGRWQRPTSLPAPLSDLPCTRAHLLRPGVQQPRGAPLQLPAGLGRQRLPLPGGRVLCTSGLHLPHFPCWAGSGPPGAAVLLVMGLYLASRLCSLRFLKLTTASSRGCIPAGERGRQVVAGCQVDPVG